MMAMGSTADSYLSPALEYMTVKFSISESLAGVTLLAFGNGAPDVFASVASAAKSDDVTKVKEYSGDGFEAMTPLLGSAFFISSVVIPLALYASAIPDENGVIQRYIKLTPKFFVRDIIFFYLVLCYILIVIFFI
jgi:sodium/potassium/calcium exchanger 6